MKDHDKVERYVEEAGSLGFDIVEISSGFIAIDTDDLVASARTTHPRTCSYRLGPLGYTRVIG